MLQRKQTVFFLLALVVTVLCLCMQIGSFEPQKAMAAPSQLYNLWTQASDGTKTFAVWPLFAVLLLTCPISIFAIFSYKQRPVQSLMCMFNIILILIWYVLYVFFGYIFGEKQEVVSFRPLWTAALPLVALIFYILARRGVMADEKLIKAADRIR